MHSNTLSQIEVEVQSNKIKEVAIHVLVMFKSLF